LNRRKPEMERRRWIRLPLAIPVFVRSRDEKGKDFLEFATTLNVSAGGALVAVRRSLPLSTQVSLEIPSAPLPNAASLPKASRLVRARSLRITHAEGYHLIGVKFSHPLLNHGMRRQSAQRKVASSV
jgi:PilZ domain-containing protein